MRVSLRPQAQQQDVALGVSSYRILLCLLSALHFLSSFSTAVFLNHCLSAGMLAHVRLLSRFTVNIYGSIINQHPGLHFKWSFGLPVRSLSLLSSFFLILSELFNHPRPLPVLFALPPSSRPVPGLVVCGSLSPDGPLWSFIDDGSS